MLNWQKDGHEHCWYLELEEPGSFSLAKVKECNTDLTSFRETAGVWNGKHMDTSNQTGGKVLLDLVIKDNVLNNHHKY